MAFYGFINLDWSCCNFLLLNENEMIIQTLITFLIIVIYDSLKKKSQPYFLILYVFAFGIYLDYHPNIERLDWIIFVLFVTFLFAIYRLMIQNPEKK